MNFVERLGIKKEEERMGYVKMSMQTGSDHMNIHGTVHGAVIFSLIDAAFEVISNQEKKAFALNVEVNYRRVVKPGDLLLAEAWPESTGRTTSVYRIKVTNSEGKVVALATALSFNDEKN
ncbi:MAG: hotdog fold thioesterase [Metallosphaera sp.]